MQKWYPIFNKFKVDIPLNCPLNPERDMFHSFHQSKVQEDPAKWSCALCGKKFHSELFLELHMLKKHKDKLILVIKFIYKLLHVKTLYLFIKFNDRLKIVFVLQIFAIWFAVKYCNSANFPRLETNRVIFKAVKRTIRLQQL